PDEKIERPTTTRKVNQSVAKVAVGVPHVVSCDVTICARGWLCAVDHKIIIVGKSAAPDAAVSPVGPDKKPIRKFGLSREVDDVGSYIFVSQLRGRIPERQLGAIKGPLRFPLGDPSCGADLILNARTISRFCAFRHACANQCYKTDG